MSLPPKLWWKVYATYRVGRRLEVATYWRDPSDHPDEKSLRREASLYGQVEGLMAQKLYNEGLEYLRTIYP